MKEIVKAVKLETVAKYIACPDVETRLNDKKFELLNERITYLKVPFDKVDDNKTLLIDKFKLLHHDNLIKFMLNEDTIEHKYSLLKER